VLSALLIFTNSLAAIYLIVLLMETMSLFFYPARNALIPYLLDDENDIAAANGLAYTTQQAAMVVGLTASGAIVAAFEAIVRYVLRVNLPLVSMMVGLAAPALVGPRAGVILNTFTFLFSAAMVATIAVHAKANEDAPPLTLSLLGRDAIDSFRFLGEHQELRGLLTTIFMALLGGGSIISVGLVFVSGLAGGIPFTDKFPELAKLAAAPETFILVFLALGMVSGALLAPRLERHMSLQLMFAGSVTAFGTGLLMFAVATRYWEAAILAIAAGGAVAMVTVAGNTYVVRTVDDEIRGRVFTALESVIRVALLISMVVMSPLGDGVAALIVALERSLGGTPAFGPPTGVRVTLFLAGAIVLSAAVYAWRTLTWRSIDTEPVKESGDL
ncbi:MAG TPA: hypothetical protein VFG89_05290, partial [Coriobacteriia bacterium]|nr:hypothetical protein [Coriobacteriia bacterium]